MTICYGIAYKNINKSCISKFTKPLANPSKGVLCCSM